MSKAWFALGLVIAAPAAATPTQTSDFSAALPGTTAAAEPTLAGTVVTDQVLPFTAGTATGTVQVRVSKGANGKLTYSWRINNAATSKGNVSGLLIKYWPTAVYNANWRKDGLGTVAPSSIARSTIPGVPEVVYSFGFATPIKPGEGSRFFFLQTDATASKPATIAVAGSTPSPDLTAFAPKL